MRAASVAASLCAFHAHALGTTLRVGQGAPDITTLDAHRATATADKAVVGWIYNGLVRFPPGSSNPAEIEPDLATKWESSADGRSRTFRLRKGVKFHGNWGEMTADDVIYSLQRAGDSKRSSFSSDFAGIDAITKVDDHTVRINLKFPDAKRIISVSWPRSLIGSP
jgi:peptide/nickel transport system substrate-binding protein